MSFGFVNGSAHLGADINFSSSSCTDIIGCLVAGIILTVLFFIWNAYLSRVHAAEAARGSSTAWWQPPPLIPGNLWFRAHGRFIAILLIVFLTWCSFLANNFWVRGVPLSFFILPLILNLVCGRIGSGKSTRDPGVLYVM